MSSSWLVTSCSWPVSSAHLKHLRQSPEPSILLQMKCWQNRFSLKIQKQKKSNKVRSSLSPPGSSFKCFFSTLHAWPLWLRRPRSSGAVLHSFQAWSGMFHSLSTDCHGLDFTNSSAGICIHRCIAIFRYYIYSTLHAPPPPQKKKVVHFWDFAPGENGNKSNIIIFKRDVNGLSELPVFLPIFTTIHSTITSSTDPGRDRRQSETVWRTWLCNVWFTCRDGSFLRQNWRYAMCYPAEIIMKNHCFSTHDRWDVHVWIFFRYFHTSIFGATVWCMSSLKGVSRVLLPEPSGVREGPRGLFWNMAAFDSNAILVGW